MRRINGAERLKALGQTTASYQTHQQPTDKKLQDNRVARCWLTLLALLSLKKSQMASSSKSSCKGHSLEWKFWQFGWVNILTANLYRDLYMLLCNANIKGTFLGTMTWQGYVSLCRWCQPVVFSMTSALASHWPETLLKDPDASSSRPKATED